MNASLQWFPLFPAGYALLLALALAAALAYGSWLLVRRSVPRRWVVLLGFIRVGMIVLFLVGTLRPVLSFPRSIAVMPDVLVLVDTSASMSQPAASGTGTRLEEVQKALNDSPALQAAARTQTLHWFTFDRRAWPTTAADVKKATAKGEGTDFASSLRSAYQHVRLLNATSGSPGVPTRALLISDGRDESSNDAVSAARELGIAVDVLAPAPTSRTTAATASIADVQCARRVLLGSETAFQVTIRAPGAAVEGLSVVLEEGGREVAREKIASIGTGQEARLVLLHHPAEVGLKRYAVRMFQGDVEVGQPRGVNVQVTDQRHDVLILEETWRWEFKYLRRVLEDDPTFNLTALLSRGGSAFVHFGEPERAVQLGGFPNSRSELDGFDTIVLGNVDPKHWPRGFARHLRDAVSEGGKSLVVIAGPNLGNWLDAPELLPLLPVELTRESGTPANGKIDLLVTPDGIAAGWFAMTPGRAGSSAPDARAAIPALPSMEQVYPAMRKRPAASILVEAVAHSNAYGPLIVMAEQTAGKGRVLFIGTDTLWRWQTLGPRSDAGVTLYSSFWQQALRGLAPADPTSSTARLWVRPERTLYRAGDRVKLSAQWDSPTAEAPPVVTAAVVLPDGRRLPLDLVPGERDPHQSLGQFDVDQPGEYRIEAVARTDARQLADVAARIEVAPRPGETDAAPVDVAALQRLASATGGRVIDPASADGWHSETRPESTTIVRPESFDLWHNFSVLLTLCTLLAADWTVRLFRGYV